MASTRHLSKGWRDSRIRRLPDCQIARLNLKICESENLRIKSFRYRSTNGAELFEQRLQDILFAQCVHRRSTFHGPLVLHDAATAGAIHPQRGKRLFLRCVERELDEVVTGSGERHAQAAVGGENGEVIPFGSERVDEHLDERRRRGFEKLLVRGRGFIQLRPAGGGILATVFDGGANAFAQFGGLDSKGFAGHDRHVHSTHKK